MATKFLDAPIVNLAAYRFVPLDRLDQRRTTLKLLGRTLGLQGTILLSPEGINLFVAGNKENIGALVAHLNADRSTADLPFKKSFSESMPFRRWLVKVKRQIIPFDDPDDGWNPGSSPRVAPTMLKSWIDSGDPIVLLDVRNEYEVRLGTFRKAVSAEIRHFREFTSAARRLPESMRDARVVTFCTGGIRCEKAAPFLQHLGFRDVWQLDGGILQYFDECGDAHYDGECFVFDHRVAVDPQLAESTTVQCFACQTPLQESDQQSPHYVPGRSCPYCYVPIEQQRQACLKQRQFALAEYSQNLPGSRPYTNRRTIWVSSEYHDWPILDFLHARYAQAGRDAWAERVNSHLVLRGDVPLLQDDRVRRGDCLVHLFPETVEPAVATSIQIVHEDEALVVVHKPAPLPVHPCGRYNHHTLIAILHHVYRPERLRLAHRIDANTTGIVVLTRSLRIARILQPQFEQRTVEKSYLVRVHGIPRQAEFECREAITPRSGTNRIRITAAHGLASCTQFKTLRTFSDGTSLLSAVPITGRTNQIRIHAWHLNMPIVGDPTYLPGHRLGSNRTVDVDEEPLCLHAHLIRFQHPARGEVVEFMAVPPAWTHEDS